MIVQAQRASRSRHRCVFHGHEITVSSAFPPLPPCPARDETADVFRSWFGTADRFEVVDATVGEIGGRLQMTWRLRLRPAPFDIGASWHVIEQHAFLDVADTISTIDLVCSGFRAESTHDTPTGGTR